MASAETAIQPPGTTEPQPMVAMMLPRERRVQVLRKITARNIPLMVNDGGQLIVTEKAFANVQSLLEHLRISHYQTQSRPVGLDGLPDTSQDWIEYPPETEHPKIPA